MIAVIGCGNLNRQDDGAGIEVIRQLHSRGIASETVRLFDAGTDGTAVMFQARGCTKLIVIDASRTGVDSGAIYEVPGSELELPYSPGLNLHDFRWDAALHAGRMIFKDEFPSDVKVFLIEAESLDLGIGLFASVMIAASTVADRVESLVRQSRDADHA